MLPPYVPNIPKSPSEIIQLLALMMLYSPRFLDKTGYFPEQSIDTVFHELNEGLRQNKAKLGEELYAKLVEMSTRMRAHFEADPGNKTGDTRKGRRIIREMELLLKSRPRKS
jgi:hypothetical protein